jgi:sodium-coupled neutral amino acid transporter 11
LASFHPKLKNLGVLTFEDLMFMPFGKLGSDFILLNMFVLGYGAMVAYLLVIKDTVPTILGFTDEEHSGSFIQREGVMIVTSLLIIVPLSMQRDMASLAFTSVLSVSADVLLVFFVAIFSPVGEAVGNAGGFVEVLKQNSVTSRLFIGLGILSTAMACQHSAFIVSGSLHKKTSARWATATFWSITTSTILCLILGVCGYLGFLDETMGDILNNFAPNSLEANAARTLLAITMFFTYPMDMFVARHVVLKLMFDGDVGHVINEKGETIPKAKLWGIVTRRHKCTLAIYVATLLPALVVNDLGPVLSITGSLGGSCLCYIGPGLVYLGVNGDAFLSYLASLLVDSKTRNNKEPFLVAAASGDLPIEGDATANMETSWTTPDFSSLYDGPKPWWWYPTFMPVWVKIATKGATGMRERLAAYEQEHESMSSAYHLSEGFTGVSPVVEVETIGPCKRDYRISIFFVCFGVMAAVAGVGTNVYVQVTDIFFTVN